MASIRYAFRLLLIKATIMWASVELNSTISSLSKCLKSSIRGFQSTCLPLSVMCAQLFAHHRGEREELWRMRKKLFESFSCSPFNDSYQLLIGVLMKWTKMSLLISCWILFVPISCVPVFLRSLVREKCIEIVWINTLQHYTFTADRRKINFCLCGMFTMAEGKKE